MGFRNREPRVGGLFFRILLMANFIAMMAYGAITPSQMTKVTAEVVTIAITAVGMVVQVYVTVARFISLPYSIWAVIAAAAACAHRPGHRGAGLHRLPDLLHGRKGAISQLDPDS